MDDNENKGIEMPQEKPKRAWKLWHFIVIVAVVVAAGVGSGFGGYAIGKNVAEEASRIALGEKQLVIDSLKLDVKQKETAIDNLEALVKDSEPEQEPEAEDYDTNAAGVCESGELDDTETSSSAEDEIIVYVTDTGTRYHRESCASLYNSKHEITLQDAIDEGYTPCLRCNPPTE